MNRLDNFENKNDGIEADTKSMISYLSRGKGSQYSKNNGDKQ